MANISKDSCFQDNVDRDAFVETRTINNGTCGETNNVKESKRKYLSYSDGTLNYESKSKVSWHSLLNSIWLSFVLFQFNGFLINNNSVGIGHEQSRTINCSLPDKNVYKRKFLRYLHHFPSFNWDLTRTDKRFYDRSRTRTCSYKQFQNKSRTRTSSDRPKALRSPL